MLLDQDFDIIENVSNSVKFVGRFKALFTSNIHSRMFWNEDHSRMISRLVANVNLIIEGTDQMYRCYVEFPANDIIRYNSINGAYYLPYKYYRGQRTDCGTRLKGHSFEIESVMTYIDYIKCYNHRNGQYVTKSFYRISVNADSLKKIDDLDTTSRTLIFSDDTLETTNVTEDTPLSFNGHHTIKFTTNIYRKNDVKNDNVTSDFFANTIIDGTKVAVSFNDFNFNIIGASRWCLHTIYRPIIGRQGATLKDHTFELDVVETKVNTTYTWDEEKQVSVATHYYTLVINPDTITRVRQKRNAA